MPGLALLVAAGLRCAAPAAAPACSCLLGPPLTSRQAVAEVVAGSDAVVEGTVVRIDFVYDSVAGSGGRFIRWQEMRATVAVGRRWKGPAADTILVYTPASTTMCGFDFAEGTRYLIFASMSERGTLGTTKCAPTTAWGLSARRIARLLGRPPDAPDA